MTNIDKYETKQEEKQGTQEARRWKYRLCVNNLKVFGFCI